MSSDNIGDRLRTIRKILSFNQETVSRKLNITKQTLSRYEKGTRFPDSLFLQKFGTLFSVNGNWLLYGKGDMFLEGIGGQEIEGDTIDELNRCFDKITHLFKQRKQS